MQNFITMGLDKIISQISIIKAQKQPTYTNFYTYENRFYEVKITPHSIIILKKESGFFRLYFFTNYLEELKNTLFYLENKQTLCIEILQKQEDISFEFLEKKALYARLKKKLYHPFLKTSFYNPPPLDAKEIQALIQKDFNIYFDHFPHLETIQNWIKNGNILSLYKNNKIISYLIFEHRGKGVYINYIANYGGKESLIEIWRCFYQKLNNFAIEFVYLWCDTHNTKAMNMYKIEGFIPDGLKNFIYIKTPAIKQWGGGLEEYNPGILLESCLFQKAA
ncbi:hypothetical protein [Helicobacter sp. 11S03491-1]|uniref:hypothetical protein n=1 Tax=Helicobacter sp. 11S03491-1 TaxID=1476196 RepID=UPI000BA610CB|nr:hypothetical protein [Helicobacter sp. 11S03491-1]PAF43779.1 hypothetical protein BKH45_00490 [Helicobacter sp. 11S03491-1]